MEQFRSEDIKGSLSSLPEEQKSISPESYEKKIQSIKTQVKIQESQDTQKEKNNIEQDIEDIDFQILLSRLQKEDRERQISEKEQYKRDHKESVGNGIDFGFQYLIRKDMRYLNYGFEEELFNCINCTEDYIPKVEKKYIKRYGENSEQIGSFYNYIGSEYKTHKQYKEALHFLQKADERIKGKEISDFQSIIVKNNISELHYETEEFDKSLTEYQNIFKILEGKGQQYESLNYNQQMAYNFYLMNTLFRIAEISRFLGLYEQAQEYVDKLVKVDQKLEVGYEDAYNLKGEILRAIGNNKEALLSFQKSFSMSPNYRDALINLIDVLIAIIENEDLSLEQKQKGQKDILEKIKKLANLKSREKVDEGMKRDLASLSSEVIIPPIKGRELEGNQGIVYAKLSEIAYLKNSQDIQESLEKYFGDNFELLDYYSEGNWETFSTTFSKNFEKLPLIVGILPPALYVNILVSLGEVMANGFAGYCVQDKNGKKYFVFRGTEFKKWTELYDPRKLDIGDIIADMQIFGKTLPDAQVQDMVKFVKKHIQDGEKVSFIGHSLGGNLGQVASTLFSEDLEKSYVFNAPGAYDLEPPKQMFKGEYAKEAEKFMEYKSDIDVNNRVINYDSKEDRVGNWGKDIGKHFQVENESHKIKESGENLKENYIHPVRGDAGLDVYSYRQSYKMIKILKYQNQEK